MKLGIYTKENFTHLKGLLKGIDVKVIRCIKLKLGSKMVYKVYSNCTSNQAIQILNQFSLEQL